MYETILKIRTTPYTILVFGGISWPLSYKNKTNLFWNNIFYGYGQLWYDYCLHTWKSKGCFGQLRWFRYMWMDQKTLSCWIGLYWIPPGTHTNQQISLGCSGLGERHKNLCLTSPLIWMTQRYQRIQCRRNKQRWWELAQYASSWFFRMHHKIGGHTVIRMYNGK